jgi:hypothetical protein
MYLFITKLVLVLWIGNWDIPFYNKIGIGTTDRKLGCTFL